MWDRARQAYSGWRYWIWGSVMILEVAALDVKPGQGGEFEMAYHDVVFGFAN
jgi:hypothetical protein